jgi:hypothetical protein
VVFTVAEAIKIGVSRLYYNEMKKGQKHVHELLGSVKIADPEDPHGHRFCAVTGEAISYDNHEHIHEVTFRTDYHENHYHEFRGKTGYSIPIGNRHVHYIESVTSVDDGHWHTFEAATLINNATGPGYLEEKPDQGVNYYEYDEEYPEDYHRT